MKQMHVIVTGWNSENESIESDGRFSLGTDEDEAVAEICLAWSIVEIGDVTVRVQS